MFSNIGFIPNKLYSLFLINEHALSAFSIASTCFSVSLYLICRLRYYIFIENVYSPKLTVFYCFIGVCFIKWVVAVKCKLISNETDGNA